jgi:streptogramin lyase
MRLAKGLLLSVLLTVSLNGQQPSAGNPYRLVENWPKLPAGMEMGQVSGVELDGRGNLWVIHRADPPILQFDASGNFLKAFSGSFVQPHSLYFDPEGNLWAVDGQGKDGIGQQIHKFSPDGKVLMSLGTKGVAGDGPNTFNGPCDIIMTASGDIFVADGHMNTRVVKFSKDGRFLTSWGTKGSGPGQLNTPHAIAKDSSGRIFVGDRGNNRIQIFDQNGKFLDEWKQFGRPTGLFIDKNDTLYVADDESDATRNPGFEPGVRVGSARTGTVTAFIPAMNTERAVADAQGNIYTAVLGGRTVRKYVRGN